MFGADFQGVYDPAKVIITVADSIVSGFADGTFVRVTYDEDRWFKRTGVDGEVTRIRNASRAGSIEITLMSSAGANDYFSTLCSRITPEPFVIGITDLSGKSELIATRCWCKRFPDVEFGKEIGERKWVFDSADIQMRVAGSNSNSVFDFITGLF